MFRLRNILFTSVLILACVAYGLAQGGGSAYTRYGLGDIRPLSSSRSMGMGGAGVAVLSIDQINENNPAGWVKLNRTRFSASVLFEGFSTSDKRGTSFFGNTGFNGFMIAVPVATQSGVVFAGGVSPLSRNNYNIVTPDTLGGYVYSLQYLGEGGLYQAHVGVSSTVGGELHLGTKLNYYFGKIRHTIRQTFQIAGYTNSEVSRDSHFHGVGFTFGMIYSGLRKTLGLPESHALSVGASLTTTSYLTRGDKKFYRYTIGSLITRDTMNASDAKVRLPFSYRVGGSYQSERYLIAAEFAYQNWNQYAVNGQRSSDLRNSYRIGIGGELLPKRDMAATYAQRIAYRIGSYYDETYYKIHGKNINEAGISGGMGVPIFGDTRLNIAVEYAIRGTENLNLQKEKILRLSFTLLGGELWFVRPEEE